MNVPAKISGRPATGSAEEWRGIAEGFEREGTTAVAQYEGRRAAPKTPLRPRSRPGSRVRVARPGADGCGRVGRGARPRRRYGSAAAEARMPASVPEAGVRLSTAPADMRKSFDGLAGLVRNRLGADPALGGWRIFINRRRATMKILGFGPGGCWIRAGGWSRAISRFRPGHGARPSRSRGPIPRRCRAASTSPRSAAASATRCLRILTLGRKNWLFCWTEVGAEAVGTVRSPVAARRLRGIDPRACPEDAPGESRSIPRAASRSPRREDGRICSPAVR